MPYKSPPTTFHYSKQTDHTAIFGPALKGPTQDTTHHCTFYSASYESDLLFTQFKHEPQTTRVRSELVLEIAQHSTTILTRGKAEAVFLNEFGSDQPHVVHGKCAPEAAVVAYRSVRSACAHVCEYHFNPQFSQLQDNGHGSANSPSPKGAKPDLLRTISGFLYQRSGMNFSACSKLSSPVQSEHKVQSKSVGKEYCHVRREIQNRGATIVVSGGMYIPPTVIPFCNVFRFPPVGRAG